MSDDPTSDDPTSDDPAASTGSLVIEQTFATSRDQVWEMFVDAAKFGGWYGPPGASLPVVEMDVTVGGRRKICMEMTTPDGEMQMWLVGEYREIVDRERLVYTEMTADPDGMPTSPETHVIVELTDSDDPSGGTNLALTHEGVPAESPGAMGWRMAIEKLSGQLE